MEYLDQARAICTALNDFHLPRAIAHVDKDRFVAWNETFLAEAGFASEELEQLSFRKVTHLEEPAVKASNCSNSGFLLRHFRFTCRDQKQILEGQAASKGDGYVLLLLDPFNASADAAWLKGRDDERSRILKLFHDEVGPKLLAAVFTAQVAKEELEARGLKESESMAKVGDALVDAIEGVVAVLDLKAQ